MFHLFIENLERRAQRLLEDFASVGSIRIVAEIRPFIHEAFAFEVNNEPEGIRMLLVELSNRPIAKGWSVDVPSDRVTTTPMPVGLGANVQGHTDAVAGVIGHA